MHFALQMLTLLALSASMKSPQSKLMNDSNRKPQSDPAGQTLKPGQPRAESPPPQQQRSQQFALAATKDAQLEKKTSVSWYEWSTVMSYALDSPFRYEAFQINQHYASHDPMIELLASVKSYKFILIIMKIKRNYIKSDDMYIEQVYLAINKDTTERRLVTEDVADQLKKQDDCAILESLTIENVQELEAHKERILTSMEEEGLEPDEKMYTYHTLANGYSMLVAWDRGSMGFWRLSDELDRHRLIIRLHHNGYKLLRRPERTQKDDAGESMPIQSRSRAFEQAGEDEYKPEGLGALVPKEE